jgi:acyl-CoA thioesterase
MISRRMGAFEDDTAVQPVPGSSFSCELDDSWWIVAGPNGGYLAAIVVRALEHRFDARERPLRSLTVQYLSVPEPGTAQIEVIPEREGRSVTFARVRLSQGGSAFALGVAVLARSREGMELDSAVPPGVPAPEALEPLPDSDEAPPFARHFDYRPALTPAAGEAVTGGWLRLREERDLDAALVTAFCDSWFPAVFAVVHHPIAVPTLDLTVHLRSALPRPDDWVLGRFVTRTVSDGLLEEDGELFSTDGKLLAQSRQLALAR